MEFRQGAGSTCFVRLPLLIFLQVKKRWKGIATWNMIASVARSSSASMDHESAKTALNSPVKSENWIVMTASSSSKRRKLLVVIPGMTHLLETQGVEGRGIAHHIVVYPLLLSKKLACATL